MEFFYTILFSIYRYTYLNFFEIKITEKKTQKHFKNNGRKHSHLKEWLMNQKQPNHFPRPFTLNVFTTIIFFFLMFINCMH
jgi:hypothetical protein